MKWLISLNAYRFFTKPWLIIFYLFFPIGWFLIGYFIYENNFSQFQNLDGQNVSHSLQVIPGYMLYAAPLFGFILPTTQIALERLSNQIKMFRTLNIKPYQYLLSIFLVNFGLYLIIILVELFFIVGKVGALNAAGFFSILFSSIYGFVMMSVLAIAVAQFPKNKRAAGLISTAIYLPILLLSGVTLPPHLFDQGAGWFKYIQFTNPIGASAYYNKAIIDQQLGFNTMDWRVDWLGIVIPMIEFLLFGYIGLKKFKWH